MNDVIHQYECSRNGSHQVTNESWPCCAYCKLGLYMDMEEDVRGSALWSRRYIVQEEPVG